MNLGQYDLADSIATALVFLGVTGESLPEFFSFPKDARRQQMLKKASLALLILGLAGELWAVPGMSSATKTSIAAAGTEAALANARAANLDDEAEHLRNQNFQLQGQLEVERTQRLQLARDTAPRYFLFQAVHPKLRRFAGTKFVVWFVQDSEAERLARLIDETLRQAGWLSTGPLMEEQHVNAYDEGIYLDFRPQSLTQRPAETGSEKTTRSAEAARAFSQVLIEYNVAATPFPDWDLPSDTIRVRVQFKPDPKSNRVLLDMLKKGLSGKIKSQPDKKRK